MIAETRDADESWWNRLPDLSELKLAYQSGGLQECKRLLERKLDEWKNVPLNVAVIGNSGVGKSSFINAIRRLTADDEGAAAVDVKECTDDIESYPHPNNPLLKFWDLPGVGTDRFPKQTYLDDIDVDSFDFFLLITADRFTENDTWLGNEFRKRNKKYFFVRTKIRVDISNNKKAHPRTHNEETLVREIRESTEEHLRANGCEEVAVFLIDSYKLEKFDFDELEKHFVEKFPDLKRSVLILSLDASGRDMIERKVEVLRSRIRINAALSAVLKSKSRVVKAAEFYCRQLGIDESSLKRLSEEKTADYEQLQSAVDRCLGCRITDEGGYWKLVEPIAAKTYESMKSLENTFLPIFGIPSFLCRYKATRLTLHSLLMKIQDAALEIAKLKAAALYEANGADSDDD